MLEHRTPWDSLSGIEANICEENQRCLARVTDRSYLLLQDDAGAAVTNALLVRFALELPSRQSICARGEYTLLWMAPNEWLFEVPTEESGRIRSDLAERFALTFTVINDISDGLAVLELSGGDAEDILAGGCSLDFRLAAFPAGEVRRTMLAYVPLTLWRIEPERFRLLVDRSFAAHLWNWLAESLRRW